MLFKTMFKRTKPPKSREVFEALNDLETELGRLKEVADIMDEFDQAPPYLCDRIMVHTKNLRLCFNAVWDVV